MPRSAVESLAHKLHATPRPSVKKQGGPENPQARQHTARFFNSCGVGSCALREIDVRSLLKHRAHWWYERPQFMGLLKRICKDAFRVAGAVQKTCSSEMLGGQGADFLRGVAFWSIRYVDFLRWFCVTGAALRMTWHQFFVAGAILWSRKIAKRIGTRLSALHSTFHFWRKSRKIVFFDVVKFKNWRSLAELLCFGCCQVQKNEEVSQNCFVLDVVTFKN